MARPWIQHSLSGLRTAALLLPCILPVARAASPSDAPGTVPGWRVELVAQTPVIRHPSVVCVAPDGRVFVAEDPMDISAPAHAKQGRIVCLHPDGTRTVFAEGLHAVFGMQYLWDAVSRRPALRAA
jgi:hypothetical protein